jgi:hypothetical protein
MLPLADSTKNLTKAEASLRGQIGGYKGWSNTPDRKARAERGHETRLRKLEAEVDPDGVMSPEDRRKAAINRRKADMAALAFKASKKRRAKNGGGP